MLEYNEIKERKVIVFEGEPYKIQTSHVFRKQQRKPVNAVKMQNLFTGRVVEHSFHVSDKAEEADLITRKVKFLYLNKGEYWFCEEKDPSKRFNLTEAQVGTQGQFMKPNTIIDVEYFGEKLVGVSLPVKVELKVTEAAPAVKGNTVQGGVKQVVLETGATVNVPMFINEGDILRIHTETGEYVERVS